MSSRQSNIQEDTYFRILRILNEQPDITQRELAQKLGLSVSGLNYCLKALVQKGLVKIQNFKNSKNKFGYIYLLTPAGVSEKTVLTSRFLKRKLREFELLKKEIENVKKEIKTQEFEFK
jgi:EPS-associated MarR family transcriptional regulator